MLHWIHVLDAHLIQLPVVDTQIQETILLLLHKNTGALYGDTLSLMDPLLIRSQSCSLNSFNSAGAIRYGRIDLLRTWLNINAKINVAIRRKTKLIGRKHIIELTNHRNLLNGKSVDITIKNIGKIEQTPFFYQQSRP